MADRSRSAPARRRLGLLALAAVVALAATACTGRNATADRGPAARGTAAGDEPGGDTLTVYSRDPQLGKPLFKLFEQQTGTTIRIRSGDPIDLADQVIRDGANSPADVFYAPLSDALGSLSAAGRLAKLADDQLRRVPEAYRSPDGTWVGTTGRAHVVFYNTDQLSEDDLPDSILGFTDPAWRGRIGWDPSSRSLQDVVTALRQRRGKEAARRWLQGIQANAPATFQGAEPIIDAVAAGRIVQVGFGSHSYLPNLQADGQARNVAAKFYPGDPGGLLNVAGVGILKGTDNKAAARAFVDFMLSPTAQRYSAQHDLEIPVAKGAEPPNGMPTAEDLIVPNLDPRRFEQLQDARRLLTDLGIIGA
jgi:iron(III) transport system substrate-binding protein